MSLTGSNLASEALWRIQQKPSPILLAHAFPILLFCHKQSSKKKKKLPGKVHVNYKSLVSHELSQSEYLDLINKQQLLYFCSVIVQISSPSLTLEQEFF